MASQSLGLIAQCVCGDADDVELGDGLAGRGEDVQDERLCCMLDVIKMPSRSGAVSSPAAGWLSTARPRP